MNFVFAGGGTGGHLFPGIAIARALQKIEPNARITFVGTNRGLERKYVPEAGYKLVELKISGIFKRSLLQKCIALLQLPFATLRAILLLHKLKTHAVIGLGGYASFPVICAAFLLRIPSAICEQNSIPGVTNRLLCRIVKRVFTVFNATKAHLRTNNIRHTGNPLRPSLLQALNHKCETEQILILGGSLGAQVLNQIVPKALNILQKEGFQFEIYHQTGIKFAGEVRAQYEDFGIQAQVDPFIDDMAAAYATSKLAICRSGATTVSEVAAFGLPTIFIPFPFATHDHQTCNASELADKNAAILLPQAQLTPFSLSESVRKLLSDESYRKDIKNRALGLAKLDAADTIAREAINRFQNNGN